VVLFLFLFYQRKVTVNLDIKKTSLHLLTVIREETSFLEAIIYTEEVRDRLCDLLTTAVPKPKGVKS